MIPGFVRLDGVPGWFGGVLAARWGGPAEGAVGELVDVPARVLLDPVVVPALGTVIIRTFRAAHGLRRGLACLDSQLMSVRLPKSGL